MTFLSRLGEPESIAPRRVALIAVNPRPGRLLEECPENHLDCLDHCPRLDGYARCACSAARARIRVGCKVCGGEGVVEVEPTPLTTAPAPVNRPNDRPGMGLTRGF